MKKILFITSKMNLGGVEKSLLRLLQKLNKKEYNITLLLIKKEGPLLTEVPQTVNVIEMPFVDEKYREESLFIYTRSRIRRFLEKIDHKFLRQQLHISSNEIKKLLTQALPINEEYDLAIDFHGYGHFGLPYLTEKIKAKKKVEFIHDENISGYYSVYKYMKKIDEFFAVSEACKKVFSNRYPEFLQSTKKFENIFDVEQVRLLSKNSTDIKLSHIEDHITMVSVGRLEKQKGFDRGINELARLKKEGYKFLWYIMGDGSQKKRLIELIKENDLENQVFILGSIDNPFPVVIQADLFLQVSRHEGKPLSVFEAQALGVPVFATKYSAADEQINNGVMGFIVDNNSESVYEGLKHIFNHKDDIFMVKSNLSGFEIDNSKSLTMIEELLKD